MTDYYKLLGVESNCDFKSLKKAYYRKAKECHPDRFNNCAAKTEEFKILVGAFDILSDPEKRRKYDFSRTPEAEYAVPSLKSNSIMDSEADDILEELLVGTPFPDGTSLSTLFMDFARTEVFITFREGKTLFFQKRFRAAQPFFVKAVVLSPNNILYQVFLARNLAGLRKFSKSLGCYQIAVSIGGGRIPQQRLERVKYEMESVKKKRSPFWNAVLSPFAKESSLWIESPRDEMLDETNRALAKLARQKKKISAQNRKRLK
jgi:tetratricopeptide (TPR) repeat protein